MQFRPGVLTGKEVTDLLNYANDNKFALPAVNVTGSNTINAVLKLLKVQSPVMIQFSNGGAQFHAGKGLNKNETQPSQVPLQVHITFTTWQKNMVLQLSYIPIRC